MCEDAGKHKSEKGGLVLERRLLIKDHKDKWLRRTSSSCAGSWDAGSEEHAVRRSDKWSKAGSKGNQNSQQSLSLTLPGTVTSQKKLASSQRGKRA